MDILRPSFRYRIRLYVLLTSAGIILLAAGIGLAWMFAADMDHAVRVNRTLQAFIIIILVGYLVSLWVANRYYQNIFYELHEDGIILHRGLAIPSEQYINLRSVAGVTVKRDLVDRWLEIGTLEFLLIESLERKPECVKLVGISDANEGYRKISNLLLNNWSQQLLRLDGTEENLYRLASSDQKLENLYRRVP